MIKSCKTHGQTKHALRKKYWKCKKCEYEAVKRRRHRVKRDLVEHFGGSCIRCGYDKCLRALSFHHRDPGTKKFQVTSGKIHGWEKLLEEAGKCDLLCSNCHMETEEGL